MGLGSGLGLAHINPQKNLKRPIQAQKKAQKGLDGFSKNGTRKRGCARSYRHFFSAEFASKLPQISTLFLLLLFFCNLIPNFDCLCFEFNRRMMFLLQSCNFVMSFWRNRRIFYFHMVVYRKSIERIVLCVLDHHCPQFN